MSDLHPHWRATGSAPSEPKRPAVANTARVRVEGQRVSRAPAAVVGILVVVTLGLTILRGWQPLVGQILEELSSGTASSAAVSSAPSLAIHVTSTGLDPKILAVHPGDTVTFVNDDLDPHIFSSTTLRDGSGRVLTTPTIFAGSSVSVKIFKNEVGGDYLLTSSTNPAFVATITVLPPATAGGVLGSLDDVPLISGMGTRTQTPTPIRSSTSSKTAPIATGTSVQTAASSVATNTMTAASSSEAALAVATGTAQESSASSVPPVDTALSANEQTLLASASTGVIPVNPFTVASDANHSVQSAQNSGNTTTTKTTPTSTLHSGANLRPPVHSETGPEIWIALAGSGAGLLVATRRQLKGFIVR